MLHDIYLVVISVSISTLVVSIGAIYLMNATPCKRNKQ